MTEKQTVIDVITAAVRAADTTDSTLIAKRILGELTDAQCREFAAIFLPGCVHSIGVGLGRRARKGIGDTDPCPECDDEPQVRDAPRGPTARERIAEDWRERVNRGWIFNGAENKLFGECTAADFTGAATLRYGQAAALTIEADKFASLAEVMRANGYSRGADIPEPMLRHVLNVAGPV